MGSKGEQRVAGKDGVGDTSTKVDKDLTKLFPVFYVYVSRIGGGWEGRALPCLRMHRYQTRAATGMVPASRRNSAASISISISSVHGSAGRLNPLIFPQGDQKHTCNPMLWYVSCSTAEACRRRRFASWSQIAAGYRSCFPPPAPRGMRG